jgi:chromosomal replication initiation ATPase DnaA
MHTADSSPNEIATSKAQAAARLAMAAADAVEELDYDQAVELLNKAGVKIHGALHCLPEKEPRSLLQRFLGSRL